MSRFLVRNRIQKEAVGRRKAQKSPPKLALDYWGNGGWAIGPAEFKAIDMSQSVSYFALQSTIDD
jgi:hypothetical protein